MFQSKYSKLITAATLFLIFAIVGNVIIDKSIEKKSSYYLQVQTNLLKTKYETSYKYFKIMSKDIYTMYMENDKLIALLKEAQNQNRRDIARKKIYKLLHRNYKRLTHMGISQVHFHLPNNRSFLRMYASKNYGDDLSKTRFSVVATNKEKKPHEGFEACEYMAGLRFVYPIITKNNEDLGSVEISYSTEKILNSIADDHLYDAHILVSKEIAKNTIIGKELNIFYANTWESSNYYIEEHTHKELNDVNFYKKIAQKPTRAKIASNIRSQKAFSLDTIYNYQHIVLSFYPLLDARGVKNVAYIVTYNASNYLSNLDMEKKYMKMLFFSILALLFFFVIYVILNREKLKEMALFDNLTGLPNRTLFMIELENEMKRAQRYNSHVGLLFIDLDGFKAVNDTYGHQMGDELLKRVAKIFKTTVRKNDIVARLGGDEFTVVISDIKNKNEVHTIAQSILAKVNEEMIIHHTKIQVGASIGIALYPDDTLSEEDFIKYADNAMYISKESGKNQITFYKEN